MNLYFTYESRDTLKSFSLFLAVKTITKLNMEDSVKFEIEIQKLSHRRSRSPDNTKFDHFTLFFLQRTHRNLQRFITHVHSHCCAHETRCLLRFQLPLPSWFSKTHLRFGCAVSGFLLKQAFLSLIDFISEWTFVYFVYLSDPAVQN